MTGHQQVGPIWFGPSGIHWFLPIRRRGRHVPVGIGLGSGAVHFLVLAWDHPTEEGVARREATRPSHSASIRELWEQGHVLLGAGILDEEDVIRGSLVVVDYPTRADVNRYLDSEPFATNEVWERVEVHPLRVGDIYLPR